MSSLKTKATAFSTPSKFNFLANGKPPRPRNKQWSIGISPEDAMSKTIVTKHDLQKIRRGAK